MDSRYISSFNIDWHQISDTIKAKLTDKDKYMGIGLLNFNDSEINRWKELIIPDHVEHVILKLDPVPRNTTWRSLYPVWIDEEEQFNVPTCPDLPKIRVPEDPTIDLVAVKLPGKPTPQSFTQPTNTSAEPLRWRGASEEPVRHETS